MLDYFAKDGENLTNDEEKEQIEQIVEEYTSKKYIGADLNVEALKKGYAIHNAGIIPGQKELIEELFQKKLLKVVIATETLAAGINMPAKTVVISSPYKPCDEDTDAGKLLENPPKVLMEYSDDNEEDEEVPVRLLTSNEFKQMAGRAGRRGIDTVGYVYTLPTDRKTEQDFLYLEATECNSINSNYTPDYAFLSGYYEHNTDNSKLGEIFDKTFYVHKQEPMQRKEKISELMEISDRKTKILTDRGYLVEKDGKLSPTMLANMASRVKGYNELVLTEMLNTKELFDMTPQTLAMLAGAISTPAKSQDSAIDFATDYSTIFGNTKDGIINVGKQLEISVMSMLIKFGKTFDSFSSYDEMLEFSKSIEKPQVSEEEIRAKMKELGERRSKMYKITKTTGTYSPEELVSALLKGEVVPTKVLETHLGAVEKYKKRINAKSISQYISKLRTELSSIDLTSKGSKARARLERQQKELEADIRLAVNMQYLEENITDAMASNFNFIKKNPPEQVKNDYNRAEKIYNALVLKDVLVGKIEALQNLQGIGEEDVYDAWTDIDKHQVTNALKKLLRTSSDVYKTEIENGINSNLPRYSRDGAQILYSWTHLNQINKSDTMTNWEELLKIVPESVSDEGSIYRTIMQSADLLSQMAEMAQVGAKQTSLKEYDELRQKLLEARQLIIKEPIEI